LCADGLRAYVNSPPNVTKKRQTGRRAATRHFWAQAAKFNRSTRVGSGACAVIAVSAC
jgi:hypothetical protein